MFYHQPKCASVIECSTATIRSVCTTLRCIAPVWRALHLNTHTHWKVNRKYFVLCVFLNRLGNYQKKKKNSLLVLMYAVASDKGTDEYSSLIENLLIATSNISNWDFVSFLQNTQHMLCTHATNPHKGLGLFHVYQFLKKYSFINTFIIFWLFTLTSAHICK